MDDHPFGSRKGPEETEPGLQTRFPFSNHVSLLDPHRSLALGKTASLLILLLAAASDRAAADPAGPVPDASAVDADSAGRLLSPAPIDAPVETGSAPGGNGIVFQEPPADTLALPPLTTRGRGGDSFRREFRKYWAEMEKLEGIDKLRDQLRSNDLDKSRYPRWYLFDSSLVIMPFPPAIFLRKPDKRARGR